MILLKFDINRRYVTPVTDGIVGHLYSNHRDRGEHDHGNNPNRQHTAYRPECSDRLDYRNDSRRLAYRHRSRFRFCNNAGFAVLRVPPLPRFRVALSPACVLPFKRMSKRVHPGLVRLLEPKPPSALTHEYDRPRRGGYLQTIFLPTRDQPESGPSGLSWRLSPSV